MTTTDKTYSIENLTTYDMEVGDCSVYCRCRMIQSVGGDYVRAEEVQKIVEEAIAKEREKHTFYFLSSSLLRYIDKARSAIQAMLKKNSR